MNTTTGKQTSTLPGLDYATLQQTGIDQLQAWVGRQWTDFNEHDPGITLLENFCYSLTDLLYRTGYSMPDLLCQGNRHPYASLYTPARILTTQPVTLLDLRKLVVDVRGVGNAWIEKVDNAGPPAYYHAGSLPTLPDASDKLILMNACQGAQCLNLKGLYRVLVEKSKPLDVGKNEIVRDVAQRLHAHRPLDMDFESVQVLDWQNIQVKATIEINLEGDSSSIYLAILQKLSDYIAPKIHYYTWSERLAAGLRIDEIFDGPPLAQGFIDSKELQRMQRKTAVRVSDCIQTIMDIPGVVMVKYIAINGGLGWENWSLDLDMTKSPTLDLVGSVLTLERKGFKVNLDVAAIKSQYLKQELGLAYQRAAPEDVDVMTPPGKDRQVGRYYSVQHQLPLLYGVGAFGLPPQADAQRRAQAKQLKAYMLLFEQLLADELGQLAHLGDLLGFAGDDPSTYFAGDIQDSTLGLDALWQDPDAQTRMQRLQQIVENPATPKNDPAPQINWRRKNRFLDHLLARFAEQYVDHTQFEPVATGAVPPHENNPLSRLAALKRAWLKAYPELSRGRGTACDMTQPAPAAVKTDSVLKTESVFSTDNVAGLVKNLALKLGMAAGASSPLIAKGSQGVLKSPLTPLLQRGEESDLNPTANAAYPPLPQTTEEDAFYLVEHALLRPMDADAAQQPWPLLAESRSPDPYSLQISLVFPGWLPRYQEGSAFRGYVEKTVSEEAPAHLSVYLIWLDEEATMTQFASAYDDWLKFLSQCRQSANDRGPHPDKIPHSLTFQLRDARDRLIDLLGIGQTYPLADLALTAPPIIALDEACPITLALSQPGVVYTLCDNSGVPILNDNEKIQVTGTGGNLILQTPFITDDITYTLGALKPTGKSVLLNQPINVKVGLDASLTVCIDNSNTQLLDTSAQNPAPTDPRIVDYGQTVQVLVQSSQSGVNYQLQDSQGNSLSDGDPVPGNQGEIKLPSLPMVEDISIYILASKTSYLADGTSSTQTAILDSSLPLAVRANPALAVSVAQNPVDYAASAAVQVAGSQASVTYQLLGYPIHDKQYLRVGDDGYDQALQVNGVDVRVDTPDDTINYTGWNPVQQGNGATLDLTTPDLDCDYWVVVQAVKNHLAANGNLIQSIVQLTQAVAILAYPYANTGLGLIAMATPGVYQVLYGQPGVFYHFSLTTYGPLFNDLGLPVYIHKQDETEPTQNMGVSQLVVGVDFALPPDQDPALLQASTDLATLSPATPEWDNTEWGGGVSSIFTLRITAVKAQTGLSAVFTLGIQQALDNA